MRLKHYGPVVSPDLNTDQIADSRRIICSLQPVGEVCGSGRGMLGIVDKQMRNLCGPDDGLVASLRKSAPRAALMAPLSHDAIMDAVGANLHADHHETAVAVVEWQLAVYASCSRCQLAAGLIGRPKPGPD